MDQRRRIGVVTPPSDKFVRSVVDGVVAAIRPHRNWAFRTAGGADGWIPRMLEWKPDGIIASVYNLDLSKDLAKLNIPIVNFSSSTKKLEFPSVCMDNQRVGAMAAEYLLQLGLRQFAFWSGDKYYLSMDRADGFFQCLRDHDVSEDRLHNLTVTEDMHWQQRDRIVTDWLAGLPKPVGLMAVSDPQAYFITDLAYQAEIDIPNEIALLSAGDDESVCEMAFPSLSSIGLPARQVGMAAAEVLIALLDGEDVPTEPILFGPVGVTERGSTDMLAVDDPDIAKALRFIRTHAIEGITVANVLKQVAMARRTFEAQFQQLFGRSPGAEIRRVRVNHARKLLAETNLSIYQIASSSGFCDGEYFAHAFKKVVGMPPSHYRRQFRAL